MRNRTIVLGLLIASCGASASADVTMSKVGECSFSVDGCGGLTYVGGNQFYVLRDHNDATGYAELYPLTLDLDSSSGKINSAKVGDPVQPGTLNDSEGLAYDPGSGALWISDEATPTICEFYTSGFQTGRAAPVPAIQKKKRTNRSLESLTISGDGLTMWTANEQALTCDGGVSDGNTTTQTVVRLTRFVRPTVTADWEPSGEWAYACDTSAGSTSSQSGLAGLCALPDGSLLALEREVSVSTSGRCRIYRVTLQSLDAATEISGLAALAGATYTLVNKGKALVDFDNSAESGIFTYNMIVYEGICLGPRLSDGSLGVYLVSDGGATKSQSLATAKTLSRLCALKLSGLDVVTVDFDAPEDYEATPRGSNYRYLRGSKIAASIAGSGLEQTAYTNNGARVVSAAWTASGRAGTGSEAEITVTGDNTTLSWSLSEPTPAQTEIGSNDSFEGYAVGANEVACWTGNYEVAAVDYSAKLATPPGYPMPKESHTKVLDADDSAERTLSNNIAGNRQLDMMTEVRRPKDSLEQPKPNERVRICVDSEGYFNLWHLERGKGCWARLSSTAFADGDWVRVGIDLVDLNGESFCRVKLNGSVCPTAAGVRDPANPTAFGPWYRIASDTAAQMKSVEFMGTRVDDLLVTTDKFPAEHTGPTATNGIDFAWFDAAGLPRDPTAAAPNLPGKTVQYLHDSGVDPYGEETLAIKSVKLAEDGRVRLEFNGYKGDNPEAGYRIVSSPDLKSWTPLKSADGTFNADRANWSSTWEGAAPSDVAAGGFFKVEASPTER